MPCVAQGLSTVGARGRASFSTFSTSGPSVAVRGGVQLGDVRTSSMSVFFFFTRLTRQKKGEESVRRPRRSVAEKAQRRGREGGGREPWREFEMPRPGPRVSTGASRIRDRDRYRVSGSLRDRKDRASLPLAGAPGGGGTPDPGGEGRIVCETVRRTRDPGSRDEAGSDRWTPGPRAGGARAPSLSGGMIEGT